MIGSGILLVAVALSLYCSLPFLFSFQDGAFDSVIFVKFNLRKNVQDNSGTCELQKINPFVPGWFDYVLVFSCEILNRYRFIFGSRLISSCDGKSNTGCKLSSAFIEVIFISH